MELEAMKFISSSKGMILSLEIILCVVVIICKTVSVGCFLWCPIAELVWAIVIFIIYATKLNEHFVFFEWTDFFRAITGTLTLAISSLVCFCWALKIPGEVVGSLFGLLTAVVFGYDTFHIITKIKEKKQQENVLVVPK